MATTFTTTNNSTAFWAGFARQTIDFHNAIGELIDNALSATRQKEVGEGYETAVIEITVQEEQSGDLVVQVADAGTGIEWAALTGEENVFNIGYRPTNPGLMNEHGFGLKNALALITSGFHKPFKFLSIPESNSDRKPFVIDGPIGPTMTADVGERIEWEEDLAVLKNARCGTKVRMGVKREYFSSLYSRSVGFEGLIERLGEHLGVMYARYIQNGAEIHVRYKAKTAADWMSRKVPSILTPFLKNQEVKVTEHTLQFEHAGKEYKVAYRQGLLDATYVKSERTSKEWPFPLKIHFQGSNARCGVSLLVRNRVLKTGVFREIWPGLSGDVSFNNFLGELELSNAFSTTNNKTDIDPHSDLWPHIREILQEENYTPEKTTKQQSEENLRKKIIQQITTVHSLAKANAPAHKKVWDGAGDIDIYYKLSDGTVNCMELKVNDAQVLDVYQLRMYWDGLVEAGESPTVATLVAAGQSVGVAKAIAHINSCKDKNNEFYVFKFQPLTDWANN